MPGHLSFHEMLISSLADMPKPGRALDLKLFAMVNNDAWLENSSLEGGHIEAAASLLLSVIDALKTQNTPTATPQTNILQILQSKLNQIILNDSAMQQVIVAGNNVQSTPRMMDMRSPSSSTPKKPQAESRERLIEILAENFIKTISELKTGESFLMPGGFFAHAMLFEFKRAEDDLLVLKIYNTGGGLTYHESKTQIIHGVVKEKYLPILAYKLPFSEVKNSEFISYLTELLKAKIASVWIPHFSETIPLAYPRTAQDLYQKILPLVAHIGGQLIDPRTVCQQPTFITGQRSGKCSEAVFHPLLREVFSDESLYQRFMLAYRKITIANFMMSADFTHPMAVRQLNLAVNHLAARAYKQSALLTSEELTAMTTFTREALVSIQTRSVVHTEGLINPSSPEEEPTLKLNPEPIILKKLHIECDPLINITLIPKGAMPIEFGEPMPSCDSDATTIETLPALIEKMKGLHDWIIKAKTHPEISPKEIVVAIEQLFITYPMSMLREFSNAAQHQQLATCIQTLMTLYSQSTLQQMGVDATASAPISLLTARQVITVYSALALMTVQNETPLFAAAMQALFMQSVSESLERNTHNPFLMSMSLACDQRLRSLSILYPTVTKEASSALAGKSTQAIYAAVIEANADQKSLMLDIFSANVSSQREKFKLNQAETVFLNTEDNQCLFVLFNAYPQLLLEDQQRLSLSRDIATRLTHCHQIFSICGSMISRSPGNPKTTQASFDLLDLMKSIQLTSQPLQDGTISWTLSNPFKQLEYSSISLTLKLSQRPITNSDLSDFLTLDMNHRRKDHVNSYSLHDRFSSSSIQGSAASTPPALTEQEFLLSQFYHTRTTDSCQITATLEFFQTHPELLQESHWQTIAILNLLQPNILQQALEKNPALHDDCHLFLTQLLTINTHLGLPNQIGLFCIRLQVRINLYLMDSTDLIHQRAHVHLLDMNTTLTNLLQQPLNRSLQCEIYQIQCSILSRFLNQPAASSETTDEQRLQKCHLMSYLTAKLLGASLSVLKLKTNPDDFILQEIDMVSMKSFLIEHAEWVKTMIPALLKSHLKLEVSKAEKAPPPQLQYPNVFIMLTDESVDAGQMMATVNVETGQILKNGKEYCFLPPTLLASSTFQALAGPSVRMGWVALEKRKAVPTLFEITTPALFIKNTSNGLVFQQDFVMRNDDVERCQLIPIARLRALHDILPTPLCDAEHRFWITLKTPQQIIIQNSLTNTMIYHLGPSKQNPSHYVITPIHRLGYDEDYQLLSQADVKKSNISHILGDFEASQFISVKIHTGNDAKKSRLLISFARYNLHFEVTNTNPLTIKSLSAPHGTLVLDSELKKQIGLKNCLLIQTEKQMVALLPRRYFIDEKNSTKKTFEYTQLCLDSLNLHANLILRMGEPPDVYCNQSESVTVQLISDTDGHSHLCPKDGASALYLAYSYLANGDPYTALDQLKYWEQQGGLKGTQCELEHLMLFFNGLPATSAYLEATDKKMIQNPEYIAVRAFVFYLYANRQSQDCLPKVEVALAKQDAQCFLTDATDFQATLANTLDQTLTHYFTNKHNVPISMQLTVQQETICLRMSPRKSLLGVTYTHLLDQTVVTPTDAAHALNEDGFSPSVMIHNGSTYAAKKIQLKQLGALAMESEISQILQEWIKTPTEQQGLPIKYTEQSFQTQFTTSMCLKEAHDQLSLALLPNNFFKHFITYYFIAYGMNYLQEKKYVAEKEKLRDFLTHKMHILALGGAIPGAHYLIALYLLLDNPNVLPVSSFLRVESAFHRITPTYLFDQNKLEQFIRAIVRKTTNEIEISDARTPTEKTMPIRQLISNQRSPFVTAPAKDLTSLTYPSDHPLQSYSEQLTALHLSSLETLATESGVLFANQLQAFKKLVEQQATQLQEQKRIAVSKLSTTSFVDAAADTLAVERILGSQRHADIQEERAQAAPLFSNSEQCLLLQERVARTAISVQEKAAQLRMDMLDYVHQCTRSTLDNPIHLGALSKLKPTLNEALLINLYLEGSPQRFNEMTGLNETQTQIVYQLIADYLFVSTYHKQLVAIDQAFDSINAIAPDATLEKELAVHSLALKWITPNSVNIHIDPAVLTLFQFAAGTLLRPEQVVYLQKQFLKTNGQFNNHLCQLIMGFGKTFLLPILAKAKATGDNLSIIEVPEALFSTNLANFTHASLTLFNQTPYSFCFTRHSNGTIQELADLYDHLTFIRQSRNYLVTTGESVASLNLRFIEMLNQLVYRQKIPVIPGSDSEDFTELKTQIHWLGKLVKLFKYNADAIIDEVHAGLNIRKKLIYSVGAEPLAQDEIKGVLRLYQFILPIKVYRDLTLETLIHKPEEVPHNEWPTIMETLTTQLCCHQDSPLHPIFNKMSNAHQLLLSRYLHNQINQTEQDALFALLLMAEQDLLALYKKELSTLLPATLTKQNRRHYGLLLQDTQIMHAPCAVPFIASDTPNIIRMKDDKITTTHFANPDETLNYTIQAYLVQGLPKMMVQKIIRGLQEKAKMECLCDSALTEATTETGLMFQRIIEAVKKPKDNTPQWGLDNACLDTDEALIAALMHEQAFIFYALQHEILPTVMVENQTLEMDSTQRACLYRSIQGISGTIDNHRSISQRIPLDSAQAIGTNGVTIGLIDKKSTVHVFTESKTPLVNTFFSNDNEQNHLHAIIDAGGRFTGINNHEVAQHIAAVLCEKDKTDPRKFVLFLNDLNELSAIDKNKPKDIIFIGASDEKTIISKLGEKVRSVNWVTYFNQRHTVGMDITQAPQAVAAITVAYDGTLSAFLQAAMRMRGLPNEQRLQIFMDQSIASYCQSHNAPPTPEDVITFLSNNETMYLSDDHFRYVLAEMDNTLYQELLGDLLSSNDVMHQAEMLNHIQMHTQLFMKTTVLGLLARYGSVEKERDLEELLIEKKNQLITLRTAILEDLNRIDDQAEAFNTSLNSLISLAKKICKQTVLAQEVCEEGNQVEAEAETAVNVNTQMATATETALAVENVNASPYQKPTTYQEWLCDALTHRSDETAWQATTKKQCFSLVDMLNTTTRVLPQCQLNPEVLISINHAVMHQEQMALFDYSKMPFQCLLMHWHAGKLRTFVITTHEVEALLTKQASLFSTQPDHALTKGEQFWIESFSHGHLIAGQFPPAMEKNSTYLIVKEQLKWINGDLRSLLFQKCYVWSVRNLTFKQGLLSTILTSRPDQRRHLDPLLAKLHTIMPQDENTALKMLADQKDALDSREAVMFEIASLRSPPLTTLEKQRVLACTLIARFSGSDLITAPYLSSLYPLLTQEQAHQLATLYVLKQCLSRRLSLKPAEQKRFDPYLQTLQQAMQLIPVELLRHVVIQATTEADESLINACYSSQTCRTDLLDPLLMDETHPVLSSLQQHHYQMGATLLQNHFKNSSNDQRYNPPWLERAFQWAFSQKDMAAMKMLLDNCGLTLILSQSLASDCLVLFAQMSELKLSQDLLNKMAGSSYIKDLSALQLRCQTLTDSMTKMLKPTHHFLSPSPPPELSNNDYLTHYPDFSLQTGLHKGYSQLMLACQLGNVTIAKELLKNTTSDNRAQETASYHWNALTTAMQLEDNPVVAYLITQQCVDFYRRISPDNMNYLIYALVNRRCMKLEESTLTLCLRDLITQSPAEFWCSNKVSASSFFNAYVNLIKVDRFNAATVLYEACQSHAIVFDRPACVELMLSCHCQENESSTKRALFLLTHFSSYMMDSGMLSTEEQKQYPLPTASIFFIKSYDNRTLRQACLSALEGAKSKPVLSEEIRTAMSKKIMNSLIVSDEACRAENMHDAKRLIQVLQDKQLNTLFFSSICDRSCPISIDLLQLLVEHCEFSNHPPLFNRFLTYVNEVLQNTLTESNWHADLPRLTQLVCSLIPNDKAHKAKVLRYPTDTREASWGIINSSLLACTNYCNQVPSAVEHLLPLILEDLTNVAVNTRKDKRCNLLLQTLSNGPQAICEALVKKGARLSNKIGYTDQSALDALIHDKQRVVGMNALVSLLKLENFTQPCFLEYLKQAIASENQPLVEALLRSKPLEMRLKQEEIDVIFIKPVWVKGWYNDLSLNPIQLKMLTLACQLGVLDPVNILADIEHMPYNDNYSPQLVDLVVLLPKDQFKLKYWKHVTQSKADVISDETFVKFVNKTNWETLFPQGSDLKITNTFLSELLSISPPRFQACWEKLNSQEIHQYAYDCLIKNLKKPHSVVYENLKTVYLSLKNTLSSEQQQALLMLAVDSGPESMDAAYITFITTLEEALPVLIKKEALSKPNFHTTGLSIFPAENAQKDDMPPKPKLN